MRLEALCHARSVMSRRLVKRRGKERNGAYVDCGCDGLAGQSLKRGEDLLVFPLL